MKIIVLVKWSPDASADRSFTDELTVDRTTGDGRLSELDEYPVEQAVRLAESGVDAEVVYLTMGPADAESALRKALSMGGDRAVHLCDDGLRGSDYLGTSAALAAAIRREGFDLVIAGMASTEAGGGVLPAMLAERLGVRQATLAGEIVDIDESAVTVRRDGDAGSVVVRAELPAVISVTDQSGEARYPSFKGIMAAKKKPIQMWDLADIGVAIDDVGSGAAATAVEVAERRPPREAGEIVKDGGEGGRVLAAFLAEQRFV